MFLAAHVWALRRQPTAFATVMLLGAVAWLGANLLWLLGSPLSVSAIGWAAFLVLTVAGERLEMSRLVILPAVAKPAFFLACAALLAGAVLTPWAYAVGVRLAGAGFLTLGLWLLAFDLARRAIHQPGLTRFIGLSLMAGYSWLVIGGVLALAFGGARAGWYYDAILHAWFLGFLISMVFGHAPMILPAVMGLRDMPFHRRFYAHLVLLHVSLALRIGGDLTQSLSVRQWGGMMNVAAVLLFLPSTALAARRSRPT